MLLSALCVLEFTVWPAKSNRYAVVRSSSLPETPSRPDVAYFVYHIQKECLELAKMTDILFSQNIGVSYRMNICPF